MSGKTIVWMVGVTAVAVFAANNLAAQGGMMKHVIRGG